MENISHKVELTSAEVANLWTQYMNDSLSICILIHFIDKAKDDEIKDLLEFALSIAVNHIEKIKKFLSEEHYPIPKGFSIDEDVNLSAPPLFTDKFMIFYMHVMTLLGLTGYAGAVSTSTRDDQITYFIKCNNETMELYERIVHLMLNKGFYSRPPHINTPNEINFVNNERYLTGWFGKKRPLNAIEISGISFNMIKIIVKLVLGIGFGQVCQTKEVQKYLLNGKKLCEKQFGELSAILTESELASPPSWISEVTNSTVSPYSEKLMLNHIVILASAAVGYLAAGASISHRRDLAIKYSKLIAEAGLYVEDGAQLLIKYGWMEQPPLAEDRENLVNKK